MKANWIVQLLICLVGLLVMLRFEALLLHRINHNSADSLPALRLCSSVQYVKCLADRLQYGCAGDLKPKQIFDLSAQQISVHVWDDGAAVYVSSGADGAPGVAGVDDDGNGVVDDASELGATSSDDLVLTPTDPGYQDADSGKVQAIVLSRGAMVPAPRDVTINGPTQIRIDVVNDKDQLISKIIDLK